MNKETIAVAKKEIGVKEIPKGSNAGPRVKQYLASVGLPVGNPWCMAFVYWVVGEASKLLERPNPLVKTGSCLHQYHNTTCRTIPKTSKNIQPGDIFIMQLGRVTGHTGFVTKVVGGMIHTIEGNTNDEGSREGYEVCERVRPISSILGFIQLPK